MGYSLWGRKELDMTERLNTHTHICFQKKKATWHSCKSQHNLFKQHQLVITQAFSNLYLNSVAMDILH